MSNAILEGEIEAAWSVRESISPKTKAKVRDAIEETLEAVSYTHLTLPTIYSV